MNRDISQLSGGFLRLYCDAAAFEPFSVLHPISLRRVLPFQPDDPVMDGPELNDAEEAHLADRTDDTRREVIEAYSKCGLLPEAEAANLKSVIDYFGADFFELMGLVYANAGMFICALRWYPFEVEVDAGSLPRHKMNLIFATCGQADALVERGYTAEAKRLLFEAAMLEPEASFVRDRIKALP